MEQEKTEERRRRKTVKAIFGHQRRRLILFFHTPFLRFSCSIPISQTASQGMRFIIASRERINCQVDNFYLSKNVTAGAATAATAALAAKFYSYLKRMSLCR